MFREACAQMHIRANNFACSQDFFVSVNVSSKQVIARRFIDELDKVLQETGIRAECLRLEITESALVENTRSRPSLARPQRKA